MEIRSTIHKFLLKLPVGGILVMMVVFSCLVPGILSAQQKNYLPHDLFSASFPTARDGWACGRRGTVIHSTDGGMTWVRQQSGTYYTLSSICFVDRENGWAVGDAGTILHTEDGGKSWLTQKCPVPYFLMGVCFVNPEKGWIVTERSTILNTGDGGKTWQVQFKDKDLVLRSVSFCDEENGWAVGEAGYIYHTDDGGSMWQQQAGEYYISEETWLLVSGDFLFGVFAVDPRTAWVAGIDGYVARTFDGGTTWQEAENGVPKTHFFTIASDSEGTVLIGGNAVLLVSSDRGETFKVAEAEPEITYGWIGNIAPRGEDGFVAVGKQGWTYLTDNKGFSWQRAAN